MEVIQHKSEQLLETALAHEWKAQIKPEIPEDLDYNKIVWNLYAMRGEESLRVTWIGDRQQPGLYKFGDKVTHPAHRAAVVALLTGKPDHRKLKGESLENVIQARSVPWDADAPAIDIMLAVLGKEITWVRKIDSEVCRSTISRHSNNGSRYFRVYESPSQSGQRVLDWTDATGFHCVRIDSIIDVS